MSMLPYQDIYHANDALSNIDIYNSNDTALYLESMLFDISDIIITSNFSLTHSILMAKQFFANLLLILRFTFQFLRPEHVAS